MVKTVHTASPMVAEIVSSCSYVIHMVVDIPCLSKDKCTFFVCDQVEMLEGTYLQARGPCLKVCLKSGGIGFALCCAAVFAKLGNNRLKTEDALGHLRTCEQAGQVEHESVRQTLASTSWPAHPGT